MATAKISARQRHEEIRFEDMVVDQLEHTISTPDLWKTRVRVVARTADGNVDISTLCDGVNWQDQSSDDLANINTQAAMTGTITLKKPALRQYNKLLPPALSARVVNGVDRAGALGVVIIAQIGYGARYMNLWAMRVVPGYDANTAESITLADGTWTLNLADDLFTMAQTVADFKYTAGKKTRKQGWRCDQIALDVCTRYRVPVRTLAKGTAYFSLAHNQTHLTSPIHVISVAYQQETRRTGRTFIVRWGAPDKKHPFGALEVVPMRRNRNLAKLRQQLLDATLSRIQRPGYATKIDAHVTLAGKKCKTRKLTYTARSDAGLRRYGWVRKTINFGRVTSEMELQVLAKRSLAQRLAPLRTAELNHPGIATIRRGDAIHIDLPEEGYSEVTLNALQTPKNRSPKWLISALKAAEQNDPTMFGLPGSVPGANAATPAADANVPALLPVANQGIAFVTSAAHSVSAGSYTMDLQTSFIDVLDPREVRAQVDKTIRDWKNSKRPGKNTKGGPRWRVTASAEVMGGTGSCGHAIQADGYSELSTNPSLPVNQLDFAALGNIGCGTQLKITNPANGQSVTTGKQDVGAGSAFLPVMGLYPGTQSKLGLSGGQFTVIIERADGGLLKPVRGTPA